MRNHHTSNLFSWLARGARAREAWSMPSVPRREPISLIWLLAILLASTPARVASRCCFIWSWKSDVICSRLSSTWAIAKRLGWRKYQRRTKWVLKGFLKVQMNFKFCRYFCQIYSMLKIVSEEVFWRLGPLTFVSRNWAVWIWLEYLSNAQDGLK